jgi:TPR repeat protein
MDYQFFISYASEDLAEAQAVYALLERPGVTCWMAPDSIMPGESYVRAIPKAIRESAAVVLLFSKSADESDHVMSEISLARKYKKRIVPVRVENYEPEVLEYHLEVRHWVDFYGSRRADGERKLERLVIEVCGPRESSQTGDAAPSGQAPVVPPATASAPVETPPVAASDQNAQPLETREEKSRATTRRTSTGGRSQAAPPEPVPESAPRRRPKPDAVPARTVRRSKDPAEEYERLREELQQKQADAAEQMWKVAVSHCSRKKPDYRLARQWFAKAASAGKEDAAAERQLYQKGAAAGSSEAMVQLGLMLEKGRGVPQDVERARQWYKKAADDGNTDAMCRLGVLAMEGAPPSRTPNYADARYWLIRATDRGNADAMHEMGNWFGRKNDQQNAKMWYDRASARRSADLKKAAARKRRQA